MEKYDDLMLLIESLEKLLEEIFTGGFNVVHQGTLENIAELKLQCESYGLNYAKEALDRMYLGFEEKKHNLHYDMTTLARDYCKLNEYLIFIKNKLQLKIIKEEMEKKEEEVV